MTIFSFLLIMQSIIIGVAISEILTGVAGALKRMDVSKIGFFIPVISLLIFFGLLQIFWETWELQSRDTWTFPGMVMMLLGPILIHMVAHVLFPDDVVAETNLDDHYFSKSKLIWGLTFLAVSVSVLFRTIAFGEPLFVVDNISSLPFLVGAIALILSDNLWLHRVLASLALLSVILDVLAMSYQIG